MANETAFSSGQPSNNLLLEFLGKIALVARALLYKRVQLWRQLWPITTPVAEIPRNEHIFATRICIDVFLALRSIIIRVMRIFLNPIGPRVAMVNVVTESRFFAPVQIRLFSLKVRGIPILIVSNDLLYFHKKDKIMKAGARTCSDYKVARLSRRSNPWLACRESAQLKERIRRKTKIPRNYI
nr:hypothetical protein [Burkholderia ambifaria]